MDWERVNRMGWSVERGLGIAAMMSIAMVTMTLVYLALWDSLTPTVRQEALCGELVVAESQAGPAAMALTEADRSVAQECAGAEDQHVTAPTGQPAPTP